MLNNRKNHSRHRGPTLSKSEYLLSKLPKLPEFQEERNCIDKFITSVSKLSSPESGFLSNDSRLTIKSQLNHIIEYYQKALPSLQHSSQTSIFILLVLDELKRFRLLVPGELFIVIESWLANSRVQEDIVTNLLPNPTQSQLINLITRLGENNFKAGDLVKKAISGLIEKHESAKENSHNFVNFVSWSTLLHSMNFYTELHFATNVYEPVLRVMEDSLEEDYMKKFFNEFSKYTDDIERFKRKETTEQPQLTTKIVNCSHALHAAYKAICLYLARNHLMKSAVPLLEHEVFSNAIKNLVQILREINPPHTSYQQHVAKTFLDSLAKQPEYKIVHVEEEMLTEILSFVDLAIKVKIKNREYSIYIEVNGPAHIYKDIDGKNHPYLHIHHLNPFYERITHNSPIHLKGTYFKWVDKLLTFTEDGKIYLRDEIRERLAVLEKYEPAEEHKPEPIKSCLEKPAPISSLPDILSPIIEAPQQSLSQPLLQLSPIVTHSALIADPITEDKPRNDLKEVRIPTKAKKKHKKKKTLAVDSAPSVSETSIETDPKTAISLLTTVEHSAVNENSISTLPETNAEENNEQETKPELKKEPMQELKLEQPISRKSIFSRLTTMNNSTEEKLHQLINGVKPIF